MCSKKSILFSYCSGYLVTAYELTSAVVLMFDRLLVGDASSMSGSILSTEKTKETVMNI